MNIYTNYENRNYCDIVKVIAKSLYYVVTHVMTNYAMIDYYLIKSYYWSVGRIYNLLVTSLS